MELTAHPAEESVFVHCRLSTSTINEAQVSFFSLRGGALSCTSSVLGVFYQFGQSVKD
jgi:hypothetical protein